MRNEMDLMHMDEHQRLAWFMANRGTLIAVGGVWLAMIGWDLTHGRMPGFLLVMVPVFALLRAGLYRFYTSRSLVDEEVGADRRFVRIGKLGAALLLIVAALLPIYHFDPGGGAGAQARHSWQLVAGDWLIAIPLACVYLWPWLVLGLARATRNRWAEIVLQFAEPVLAVGSSIILLWIPQLIFETTTLFGIFILPVERVPGWGCYLAVAANGLYLVSWWAALLSPRGVQTGPR